MNERYRKQKQEMTVYAKIVEQQDTEMIELEARKREEARSRHQKLNKERLALTQQNFDKM